MTGSCPYEYRINDKATDGLTKNDHALAMRRAGKARGAVLGHGWTFLTQQKVSSKVDLDRQGYCAVAEVAIAPGGTIVQPEGFRSIRVFKGVSRNGDIEY